MRQVAGFRDGLDPRIGQERWRSARDSRPRRCRRSHRAGTSVGAVTRCSRCLSLGLCMYGSQVEQRERLAVARDREDARRRRAPRDRPAFLLGSWKRSASSFSRGIANTSGMSSLSAEPVLTPTGPISTDAIEPLGRLRGEVGCDPAADREADEIAARKLQPVHQLEIDVGDVVDAVEPVGQRRFAEARMRRRDHAPRSSRAGRRTAGPSRCRRRHAGRGAAHPVRARPCQARCPQSKSCVPPSRRYGRLPPVALDLVGKP